MSKRDMLKRSLGLLAAAVTFGVVAAVTFVVSRPVAERFLAKETTAESIPVTIPKDDPETLPSEPETTSAAAETEPIEDILKSAMEKYPFSVDDLDTLYGSLRTVVQKADKGIVTVHSVKTQTDWFNNPVENSGLFSGIITASANDELLVLTPERPYAWHFLTEQRSRAPSSRRISCPAWPLSAFPPQAWERPC